MLVPAFSYFKKSYKTEEPLVDRKVVLEVLRAIKRQYYPVFKQIAFMSDKIRSETKFTD